MGKNGVFEDLLASCAEGPDWEYFSIDSTIAHAGACAAGYGEQEAQGLGRSKVGWPASQSIEVYYYR